MAKTGKSGKQDVSDASKKAGGNSADAEALTSSRPRLKPPVLDKNAYGYQPVKLNTAPKRIAKIQFGTMSQLATKSAAEFEVANTDLMGPSAEAFGVRQPAPGGCLDPRLGVSNKVDRCKTCHQKLAECAGHFGYIQLKLPVFHAGFFKHTLTLLQCVCKSCSRILLNINERERFLRRLQADDIDALGKTQLFKRIVELCKRNHKCYYCDHLNGVVKKLGGGLFKIVHDVGKGKGYASIEDEVSRLKLRAALLGSDRNVFISKAIEEAAANGGSGVLGDGLERSNSSSSSSSSAIIASSSSSGGGASGGGVGPSGGKMKYDDAQRLSDAVGRGGLENITPLVAYNILRKMTTEDITMLWMNKDFGHPESLIMWAVPVPPVPIRPSVPVDMAGGGTTEDDLTVKLQEIIMMNSSLENSMERGINIKNLTEDWEVLQMNVAQFINGETPGLPRAGTNTKAIRGLCQRLKGKQGRFRGNLSGKRVDFSGRTVISPDPNLAVEEVGVPSRVATVMTYPERVFDHNLEEMRRMVINGPKRHPGANVIRRSQAAKFPGAPASHSILLSILSDDKRKKEAEKLKPGDIVERHMRDGDVVMFNRQPSLHTLSIMAHRVRVMPWRTFRFNECACSPYNADFDGDEMNLHLPQTEEARAEAIELMNITKNLVTPRNGETLVAATQDFLTAAFLLTRKDNFMTRAEFVRLAAYFSDATEHVKIPPPAILKPHALYTGKQLIQLLIAPGPDSRYTAESVNVESKEKFYSQDRYMCLDDGYVCIDRGELLSGRLGKKTLGAETKTGLFHTLIRDATSSDATRVMGRLAKLSARYIGDRGFSIGLEDVTPPQGLLNVKQDILVKGQAATDEVIQKYHDGTLQLHAGCDALQSLESDISGILGRIRQRCGDEAMRELQGTNAALCMAQAGSKGSPLNISQMVACLGQQSVAGSRIQNGFDGRSLPHFEAGALTPDAKGFAGNSFYSGLTPTEFFFHTMGGREGLVDTAVKTAETGYMARRLMKALEDLSMQYDHTVRNSEKHIVQFSYGDDRLDPHVMEAGGRPVAYPRLLKNVLCRDARAEERALLAHEIVSLADKCLMERRSQMAGFSDGGIKFTEETLAFFQGLAAQQLPLEKQGDSGASDHGDTGGADAIRAELREMTAKKRQVWRKSAQKPGSKAHAQSMRLLRENVQRITAGHVTTVVNEALRTYARAIIEPGEAVGAIGAQSLSEPGTQMTLKTFHFAGVASMNVTLGVPRLKEIINGSKVISTPIIEARLCDSDNIISARLVKAQIEKTTLGEVTKSIEAIIGRHSCYVKIVLDELVINNFNLNVNAYTVRQALLSPSGGHSSQLLRNLDEQYIQISSESNYELQVFPPDLKPKKSERDAIKDANMFDEDGFDVGRDGGIEDDGLEQTLRRYFHLHSLKKDLPHVIVKGVPSISRAIINEEERRDGKKEYYLLLEGYGLAEVMGASGVRGVATKSNHIIDMQRVLGIEAARACIADEIKYIMSQYGIVVDVRHLMLLSDVMTFRGEVLGITRFGVAKMRESVLMLASFEKTTDHLFDAAVHSRVDDIVGVSECIIMGAPIPLGTGLFKLVHHNKEAAPVQVTPRRRLFEQARDKAQAVAAAAAAAASTATKRLGSKKRTASKR